MGRLVRIAEGICGAPAEAEDLVQDILVKVYPRWPAIEALAERDAYLRKMLVNEYLSSRRKSMRRAAKNLRPEPPPYTEPQQDLVSLDHFQYLISQLPHRQRIAVGLRYGADLSDTEIASAMGCSVASVRGYISKAKTALRRTIPAPR